MKKEVKANTNYKLEVEPSNPVLQCPVNGEIKCICCPGALGRGAHDYHGMQDLLRGVSF